MSRSTFIPTSYFLKSKNFRETRGSERCLQPRTKRFYHIHLGWSNVYGTEFQPVSLWDRGSNKMKWIKNTQAYNSLDRRFKELMQITPLGWILKIFLPALILIVLPAASGGVVAYFTPPRGIGYRSLSCAIYGGCQLASTILSAIRIAVDDGSYGRPLQYFFTGWRFTALNAIFWFGSFMGCVAGYVLQTVGVYRNCVCSADARYWWDLGRINPMINLASDTQDSKSSSIYWVWMGSVATWWSLLMWLGGIRR